MRRIPSVDFRQALFALGCVWRVPAPHALRYAPMRHRAVLIVIQDLPESSLGGVESEGMMQCHAFIEAFLRSRRARDREVHRPELLRCELVVLMALVRHQRRGYREYD